MIKQVQLFLGPVRVRAFILLLGITGLASLILNAVANDYRWVRPVQTLMLIAFAVGTAIIFGGRMDRDERIRWGAILLPAAGAVILSVLFLPHLLLPLSGAAVGWIIAGLFIFRSRARVEYQKAIRHLRKERYAEAVKVMDALIITEPDVPEHYRLRAEILRLWGKLGPARRDYKEMTELAPNSAVAFNGLAEICLQAGDYDAAHAAALRAYELSPQEWVAAYNLGMIEDRLVEPTTAIEHLRAALAMNVPDARHRLLIHFYLARAYSRAGDVQAANLEVEALKKHKGGLEEWQSILGYDMAAALRAVLADDVRAAEDLIDGRLDVRALARGNSV